MGGQGVTGYRRVRDPSDNNGWHENRTRDPRDYETYAIPTAPTARDHDKIYRFDNEFVHNCTTTVTVIPHIRLWLPSTPLAMDKLVERGRILITACLK